MQSGNQKNLSLEVLCYTNVIKKNQKVPVVLKLTNNSDSIFELPISFVTGPYGEPDVEISYLITNKSGDSLTSSGPYRDIDRYIPKDFRYESLQKGDSKLIQSFLLGSLFDHEGIYKIRFFFHINNSKKIENTISSDWISIEVQ